MKMRVELAVAAMMVAVGVASGQVTLTSQDMFTTVGQYYRMYANQGNVDVTGLVGTNGGPQTWNFTLGPTDVVYRFDYVSTSDGGHQSDFPQAKLTERQTIEGAGSAIGWLYLDQVTGTGRINYGFYQPTNDPSEGQFNPTIVDFPDPLKYQSSWNVNTSFNTTLLGVFPGIIKYSGTATVDAYGTIVLPGLGSLNCLRVNEQDQYETDVDLDMTGNFQPMETDYIRTYFFLSPGHGIVAIIVSQQSTSAPPPPNFTTAAEFARMFYVNRGTVAQGPAPVKDLTATRTGGTLLLNWSRTANTTSYRIEYTAALGGTNTWQSLVTTTNASYLDTSASTAAQRFYRAVSLGQ